MKDILNLLIVVSIAFGLACCNASKADDYNDSSTEAVDSRGHLLHFVSAYAATLTLHMLLRKVGMKPWEALIFSTIIVSAVGGLKEMTDAHGPDKSAQFHNMLGSGAAGATAVIFNF